MSSEGAPEPDAEAADAPARGSCARDAACVLLAACVATAAVGAALLGIYTVSVLSEPHVTLRPAWQQWH